MSAWTKSSEPSPEWKGNSIDELNSENNRAISGRSRGRKGRSLMNAEEQLQLTRQTMLRVLSMCSSYMLSESIFFTQVNIALDPHLTLKEFQIQLQWLEKDRKSVV